MRQLQGDLTISVAEEYAQGHRCFTVVHGDPETADDEDTLRHLQAAMDALPQLLGGQPSQLVRMVGTNDTTTWWWHSTDQLDAQDVVDQALIVARRHQKPWWQYRQEP